MADIGKRWAQIRSRYATQMLWFEAVGKFHAEEGASDGRRGDCGGD